MAVTESTRRALKEIGLTEYEISCYLSLLGKGPRTASQVSKDASVPYSKVYDVLASLEAKGWVEVENTRPKRYFPKPPSEALEATRLSFESRLQNSLGQARGELDPLYLSKEQQERPDIWIVRGAFNVLSRIRDTLNATGKTLMIATPGEPRPFMEMLQVDLQRLRDRGVSIRIMVAANLTPQLLETLFPLGEVRVRDRMFGGGVVSDGKRAVLVFGTGAEKDYLALCSDHIGVASLAREYFQYLWDETETPRPTRSLGIS
jgi:sugar-specific transcriptional regulator TrmB